MQTAKFIYILMWALFIVPLIGFNVKRLSEKKYGEKRSIKWGFIAFIAALCVFISVFLLFAYKVTLDTRYELAAERYIDLHAEYVTGQLTYDEYISQSALLETPDADTAAFTDALANTKDSPKESVRFQIGNWITPQYYQDDESFPKTEVVDANNPVFVIYLLDVGDPDTIADDKTTLEYYLIEMIWSDGGGWKIAYHAPATDEQLKSEKDSLPSLINGKWFAVSA